MNKKTMKTFLIMSLALIIILVGCGKKSSKEVDIEAEAKKVNKTGFPIVDDSIELTILAPSSSTPDWNDVLVYNEYEKMTNIDINWEMVSKDGLDERKNITLNTNDYPDAFHSAGLSAHEIAKYGGEGIFIPIEGLLEEYAPNFTKLMEENPNIRSAITMPDGHIYSFPRIFDPEFKSVLSGWKLWLNNDFLTALDMKEPKTLDEYYDFLVAIKEGNPTGNGENNETPLQVNGDSNLIKVFSGAFGLLNRGEMNKHIDMDPKEDELRFIPTAPEYKELLQWLNKLYEEKLINQDLYTVKSEQVRAMGVDGLFGSVVTTDPASGYDHEGYIGAVALEGPNGDAIYGNVKDPVVAVGGFVITDNNPNPAATIRWMDYFYGDEGTKLYFMGKKGMTYEELPDGSVEYTDLINNNPDGLSYTDAISKYMTWRGVTYPGIVKEAYFKGSEGLPTSIEAAKKFQDNVPDEVWPTFNFNPDESAILSSIGVDIEDLVKEMNAMFITGESSFDEWDKYVSDIEGMGLDEYMDAYESAYKRYLESRK